MPDAFATVVAVRALAISGTTAWLTLFRRGSVRMTRPTVIFFGPDASGPSDDPPLPKVFLRTLLVANSKRGRVVESIAANHHFLAPTDASSYRFVAGHYRVNVFALLLGDRKQKLLFTQELEVTPGLATQLEGGDIGCYWDWGPDSSAYIPHIDSRLPARLPGEFREPFERSA